MLIILGGLPGTGKTTVAKELAKLLKSVYLRVDTVEQALIAVSKQYNPTYEFIGPEGYEILYAVGRDNLLLGNHVIVDSVNPIQLTRDAYRSVAKSVNAEFIEVEFICSNEEDHKNRIQLRAPDIKGHKLPTWEEVLSREYEPWESRTLLIDTSKHSIEECVSIILNRCN
ncbi:TPA: AAA family ATPase [Legionella pneumophila]|uniref:AAA family ATPase n=1 Tax=Legionella pneumophila TaxID=446 RepID=UPI0007777421|nr:AAA family ATPase [Legionella pneumophila]HAT8648936.1 AAA family ATPase [Legionella pneumophila]